MTILKQAAFSIAFAVLAVAVVKYGIWIVEQKGWLNPWTKMVHKGNPGRRYVRGAWVA
jgi:hypothetical protein